MRQAIVNGRWNLWVPDHIAEWDAITGDYSARQGWEFARFESMQKLLRYGDCLFDIGTEHGWISAILAREFVGGENMVLFEPGPEFWINIRKTWEYNRLDGPKACWQGFVDEKDRFVVRADNMLRDWPQCADPYAADVDSMPYRSMLDDNDEIMSISIDGFVLHTGIQPTALNIDVEGAELRVLYGAAKTLREYNGLEVVWVSIHPDLMMRDYGVSADELHYLMKQCGWQGTHLGTDHEQHFVFERK